MDGGAAPEVQEQSQSVEIEREVPVPSEEEPKMEDSPDTIMKNMSSWKFHQILNQL